MKSIFCLEFKNPQMLETDNFVMLPTDTEYFESDHVAVMKSKNILRLWSQSEWPEDNFSLEQNKEDLSRHVEDNVNHAAYGYMFYSLDRKACYGSLYVNPILPVLESYEVSAQEESLIRAKDARIDYWVVEGQRQLEKQITEALQKWFADVWKISVAFSARTGMDQRIKVYEDLKLKKGETLKSRTSDAKLMLFY